MTRIESNDLLNNLYHVILATELLGEDDIVAISKAEPFAQGAEIVIELEIYDIDRKLVFALCIHNAKKAN